MSCLGKSDAILFRRQLPPVSTAAWAKRWRMTGHGRWGSPHTAWSNWGPPRGPHMSSNQSKEFGPDHPGQGSSGQVNFLSGVANSSAKYTVPSREEGALSIIFMKTSLILITNTIGHQVKNNKSIS